MSEFGIFLEAVIAPILLIIGIMFLFFESKRRLGLNLILAAIVIAIVGFSICSYFLELSIHSIFFVW